jgi:hypothetical protein
VRLARPGPGGLPLTVDVWRDQSDGEFAFRLRGDGDVSLMHGRTIYDVVDGRLSDVTVYSSVRRAWNIIGARFGLTQVRTTAALSAGDRVARPTLMTVPKPDPYEYTFSRDFGANVAALRRAARFAVPPPGPRLDGRALWDALLSRTRTASTDSGAIGVIIYSSSPSGQNQILLNVAAAESGNGDLRKRLRQEPPANRRSRRRRAADGRPRGDSALTRLLRPRQARRTPDRGPLARRSRPHRPVLAACYPPAVMDRWLARIFGQNG